MSLGDADGVGPEAKGVRVMQRFGPNKLARNVVWNEEPLTMELQELMAADLGFDLGITGFTIA
jgi:hypothetical protein